jgi:hypothetical protein
VHGVVILDSPGHEYQTSLEIWTSPFGCVLQESDGDFLTMGTRYYDDRLGFASRVGLEIIPLVFYLRDTCRETQ